LKPRYKLLLIIVASVLILGSFARIFEDPFHEKTEKVTFWEWLGKGVWELMREEKGGV